MHKPQASDMSGTHKCHTIKRFTKHGKSSVDMPLNQVKEGRSAKPELGMTGKPGATKTMAREFGRTHTGSK